VAEPSGFWGVAEKMDILVGVAAVVVMISVPTVLALIYL